MDFGANLETSVIQQAVQFLFAQAGEVLSAWRRRRRDPSASEPTRLEPPPTISVGEAIAPIPPPDQLTEDTLAELREAMEPVIAGRVDAADPAVLAAINELRKVLEAILGSPITLRGEEPRTIRVEDVKVRVREAQGTITGVLAALNQVVGSLEIRDVKVSADRVGKGAKITGVELT
jgi:hypothetical protein